MPSRDWDESRVVRDGSGRFSSTIKIRHGIERRIKQTTSVDSWGRVSRTVKSVDVPSSPKRVFRNGKLVR